MYLHLNCISIKKHVSGDLPIIFYCNMGAGQIGGIATLLDIDFNNAAGFIGDKPDITQGQHVVLYFSHAMIFCTGALIEAHVILTAASCVFGERYKFDVFAGSHRFLEHTGAERKVNHLCIHKGYNHSERWCECSADNLALLVLNEQFSFNQKEPNADYIINRVRYGVHTPTEDDLYNDRSCQYFGWGSRRNGFLIPLLIDIKRVHVVILPMEKCLQMFQWDNKYLCIQHEPCRDDVGSVIVCSGFARGMMISRLVDRPCGVGFLDLSQYTKFLMCGVDDSRDVIEHDVSMTYEYTTRVPPPTVELITIPEPTTTTNETVTEESV